MLFFVDATPFATLSRGKEDHGAHLERGLLATAGAPPVAFLKLLMPFSFFSKTASFDGSHGKLMVSHWEQCPITRSMPRIITLCHHYMTFLADNVAERVLSLFLT